MLIDWQLIFVVVVLEEIVVEPMRKRCVDAFDCFAKASPAEGGPATPRVVRNDDCESLVLSACPEGSLSKSRMADDCDVLGVDVGVGLEIIDSSREAPGPGRDRTPLVSRRLILAIAKKI